MITYYLIKCSDIGNILCSYICIEEVKGESSGFYYLVLGPFCYPKKELSFSFICGMCDTTKTWYHRSYMDRQKIKDVVLGLDPCIGHFYEIIRYE